MRSYGLKFAGTAALAVLLSAPLSERECAAASKEECVDAHLRGQDLREKGQLARAHQTFLSCAQPSCPALVQADCARFSEEIDHLLPTVSFAARDAADVDQPDTVVYVDGVLLVRHLEGGKSYELDPGKHTVRYVHGSNEVNLTPTLNPGEKGRVLLATFHDAVGSAHASLAAPTRSKLPLAVAGVGAATLITGGVLLALGLSQVPSSCSLSTHMCAAPPGDPVFNDAHRSVSLMNLGTGLAAGGAAVLVGGLVWYFVQPSKPLPQVGLMPWVSAGAGGLMLSRGF